MKKGLKVAGIVTLVAGALTYPTIMLVKYISKKRAEGKTDENTEAQDQNSEDQAEQGQSEENQGEEFVPALHHKKHTPHHRAAMN